MEKDGAKVAKNMPVKKNSYPTYNNTKTTTTVRPKKVYQMSSKDF